MSYKIIIPLLALSSVIWLATRPEHGYDQRDIEILNQLSEESTKDHGVMFVPRNMQERADAIADVWQIDRSMPVELILASGDKQ